MKNPEIISRINHKSGLTVPEGYFDQFCKDMIASLPEQEWEKLPRVLPVSRWQKMRPFVYMAAMFAGIWCMMKMFDLMRPEASQNSLLNNTELISAINNDDFYVDYCCPISNEDDIYDQLYEAGVDPHNL